MGENKGVAPGTAETVTGLTHDAETEDLDAMTTPTAKRTTPSPAFQFYPNDFLGSPKVQIMTTVEVGAYWLLICACWNQGSLPNDLPRLAAIARMKPTAFEAAWKRVINECFELKADVFVQRRLERERAKQRKFSQQQKDKADKRWQSHSNATALPAAAARQSSLSPSPTPSSSSTPEKRDHSRGSPIHDTSHMKHALCGRVCLSAWQLNAFIRRRNHDGADAEIRAWAATVIDAWTMGVHEHDEPGDELEFWKARYAEKWPPAASKSSRLTAWRPSDEAAS